MAFNHMGQQIPVSTFNIGGGYYSPQQAQNDLAYRKWQQDQDNASLLFNEPELRRRNAESASASSAPAPSIGGAIGGGIGSLLGGGAIGRKAGSSIGDHLQTLLGTSGDKTTQVADMSLMEEGLAKYIAQLLGTLQSSENSLTGNLMNTGMQGVLAKLQAGVTKGANDQSTAFASSAKNADLAQYATKQDLFNQLTGNRATLKPAPQTQWNPMEIPDTDVTLASVAAGMEPQPPAPPPSAGSAPFSLNTFMGGNRVKPMRPMIPAGAMA